MALRMAAASAFAGANSAASETDLCGEKTKSKLLICRLCLDQTAPLSPRLASKRLMSSSLFGDCLGSMPSALATAWRMSGRQIACPLRPE
jgi:hypothetical protein